MEDILKDLLEDLLATNTDLVEKNDELKLELEQCHKRLQESTPYTVELLKKENDYLSSQLKATRDSLIKNQELVKQYQEDTINNFYEGKDGFLIKENAELIETNYKLNKKLNELTYF